MEPPHASIAAMAAPSPPPAAADAPPPGDENPYAGNHDETPSLYAGNPFDEAFDEKSPRIDHDEIGDNELPSCSEEGSDDDELPSCSDASVDGDGARPRRLLRQPHLNAIRESNVGVRLIEVLLILK